MTENPLQLVFDQYLKGRSTRTFEAASHFVVFEKENGHLSNALELAESWLSENPVLWGPEKSKDSEGVMDITVYEKLSKYFKQRYRADLFLSPLINFHTVDDHTDLVIPVRYSNGALYRGIRDNLHLDIPDVDGVLEKRQDIDQARRLGLLGGSATVFSFTQM